MTEVLLVAPTARRRINAEALALLDHALLVVFILKLSGAWLYPSLIPSDAAPGLALINGLFLAFCLYGTVRLLFTQAAALLFAEPAYLALLAVAALGIVTSVSPLNSFGLVRTALLFFGACLFLRYRFSPLFILRCFTLCMGTMLALSILVAVATPLGTMSGFDAGRWRGVFNHKNTLGENAALTLMVAIGLYVTGQKGGSWLPVVALLAGLCLALSGSATATAAAGVGMLIFGAAWLLVRFRIRRRQGFWVLLMLLAGFALAGTAAIGPIAEALGRDLTFTGRTEIWAQFLYFAQQRPWTGWGWATISTTDVMLPTIRRALGLPYIQTPHSGYLSLVVELGFGGALLFVAWLGQTALAASRQAVVRRNSFGMIRLAIVSALIVHSLFESTSGALPSLWLLLLFATNRRLVVHWR